MNEVVANPDGVFRLLVMAARADKTVSAPAKQALMKYGAMLELSVERMAQLATEVSLGGKVPISIPSDPEEQRELIGAILDIACADGVVGEQKLVFLKRVLPMLGMRQDEVGPAVNARLGTGPKP